MTTTRQSAPDKKRPRQVTKPEGQTSTGQFVSNTQTKASPKRTHVTKAAGVVRIRTTDSALLVDMRAHNANGIANLVKAESASAASASGYTDPLDFLAIYSQGPSGRIPVIRRGVPADTIVGLAKRFDRSKERVVKMLGLAPSTINRKVTLQSLLSQDESERVVGLSKIVGQVQAMVEQSGQQKEFDAAHWVANWIETSVPALGGKCPADYLDTADGRELISGLLQRMQSGAYS